LLEDAAALVVTPAPNAPAQLLQHWLTEFIFT